jgi:hypothetical protein
MARCERIESAGAFRLSVVKTKVLAAGVDKGNDLWGCVLFDWLAHGSF